jgi:hypothetical protein
MVNIEWVGDPPQDVKDKAEKALNDSSIAHLPLLNVKLEWVNEKVKIEYAIGHHQEPN